MSKKGRDADGLRPPGDRSDGADLLRAGKFCFHFDCAVTRVNRVTSIGFGYAEPSAGARRLST
jgi:hypothetical protein